MKIIYAAAVLCVLCILIPALYLWLLRPVTGKKKDRRSRGADPFKNRFIAHRGLFDNKTDHPENSAAAFKNAVKHGFAVELDVHLTSDGKLVVFHDRTLKRMCGVNKDIFKCSYKELQQYTLLHSKEKIPLFEDVLEIIGNHVPLLLEIKPEGHFFKTAAAAAEMLERHSEVTYCVESFHPLAVWWFRIHRPEIIRGQLSTDFRRNKVNINPAAGFVLKNLLFDFLSKPDFIAYNFKYADSFSYRLCRKLYKPLNAAWTLRSPADIERAKHMKNGSFDMMIFDSFMPDGLYFR